MYLALRRVMVFLDKKCVMLFTKNILTTFSNGCLGSRNDEERSEMRYVMRIAEYVNHQIFERKLRFRVLLEACLFQCLLTPLARVVSFLSFVGRVYYSVADSDACEFDSHAFK